MAYPVEQLQREVKAAWIAACKADKIKPTAKFVVFTNTVEAANYNELSGMLMRAMQPYRVQVAMLNQRELRNARPKAVR